MSTESAAQSQSAPAPGARDHSGWRLTAGILGRTWLWFVGACLVVTLAPMLLGWRPYVIESGSMLPRIAVGDVVLSSPESDPQVLLGRVTVFTDPADPAHVKTHRIVSVNSDGTLTSKGDANPTVDSAPVPVSDVRGLGRLLVRFVGLPLIWAQTGQWLWLGLFALSVLVAAQLTARDREDDDPDPGDGPDGDVMPLPGRIGQSSSTSIAASRPTDPGLARHARAPRRWRARTAYVVLLTSILTVPTAQASMAATSASTANAWTIGNWDYATSVTDLSPYLYWKLDETGTRTRVAADSSGNGNDGQYNPRGSATYFTRGVTGALATDTPNLAVTLENSNACINTASTTPISAPAQLTEIVWFSTTTTSGGKMLGFEQPRTGIAQAGNGGTYDRHLYMDGNGKVWFGVYNAGDSLISSPGPLNDGAWHMAVGTLGTGGMKLYIDGVLVGTNPNTVGEATTGWWRAGCGNLAGWGDGWTGPNSPTSSSNPARDYPFAGSLDEIAIWNRVLTATEIRSLYVSA